MASLNITLARFFGLSLAIHSAVFVYVLLVQKLTSGVRSAPPPITVSLLPPGEKSSVPAGSAAPTKIAKIPTIVARRNSQNNSRQELAPRSGKAREPGERAIDTTAAKTATAIEKNTSVERQRDEAIAGLPVPTSVSSEREIPFAKSVVGERQLPTVKELLPPVTYSSGAGKNSAPISLDTKDPVYLSYFNRIKQAIEQNWEYPELALRYGLQGRLSLEFSIGTNGHLEQLRIMRSSGSQLLDDEALRAIRTAAPFPPLPSWMKSGPLTVSASMEYNDNRLNYRHIR